MKLTVFICFMFLFVLPLAAQEYSNEKEIKVAVRDSVLLSKTPIYPRYLKVKSLSGVAIDSTLYKVDYNKGVIYFKNPQQILMDSLKVRYLPLPEFMTDSYQTYADSIVLDNNSTQERLVALRAPTVQRSYVPFSGLQTSGSITRGLRTGNNQNSVVDSELDLRITGALSEKVSLRASIQDANVPQTQNGYAQRLDEFDQIFIELYGDQWQLRAGDVDLQQSQWHFNNFTKRVQGILGAYKWTSDDDSKSYVQAAGALVRGIFNISRFTGQEGNQGPYKLVGRNGELFILVVSGSERVYVNGVLLTRGENADYVIDYNAGEVRFNATFPINSEMRISIEYQYSERNFSRFVGYAAVGHDREKFKIEAYGYTESDAKNQPLQQNLTRDQVAVLEQAGDDPSLAVAPSAVADSFSENKILYRQEVINGVERFVFSQDPNDELFNVRFTNVGANQGNYRLINDQAIANIYEYVPPIAGVPQGNFEPVIRLFAPTQLNVAGVKATYQPSTTTLIDTEFAASHNDLNRFSSIDDDDNRGVAAKLGMAQRIWKKDSLTYINARLKGDYIGGNFRNVERVYNIEFNRDWNIDQPLGDQLFTGAGIEFIQDSTLRMDYSLEHLEFKDSYNGNKHQLHGWYRNRGWDARFRGSALQTNATQLSSSFYRMDARALKRWKNRWSGVQIDLEDNQQMDKTTSALTGLSQRYMTYGFFAGIGDSTATFIEVGYKNRRNDSLRDDRLQRVNTSNDFYIKSRPLKNDLNDLRVFFNYRVLKSQIEEVADEVSLNSRVQYQRKWNDNMWLFNTAYETNSATVPRQDFTYVAVNPGQGTFTWIDYNNDGIQDLNEFEVAQFADQGRFVRILLPNQVFLPTHQNKWSSTLTWNPSKWNDQKGWKKILAHFYNQTSYVIDRMSLREGRGFSINPFTAGDDEQSLNRSFRNSLFFNRGKQQYTVNYTILSTATRNLQSIGALSSAVTAHQLRFNHKVKESWLITLDAQAGINESRFVPAPGSTNNIDRDFKINEATLRPHLSYLFNESSRIDVFYEYQQKENLLDTQATLYQQNLGVSASINKAQEYAVNTTITYVNNDFTGVAFSPVGFQMLEGLQPGRNFTWNVLFQKKVTTYLDLNLAYNGRQSEGMTTIHTGSVQLKAYF